MDNCYGLPELVISMLESQSQKNHQKLKCKIIIDGDFAQLTLSWLPDQNENKGDLNSKRLHYRKKAPCEIRRDRKRMKQFKDSKLEMKTTKDENNGFIPDISETNAKIVSTPQIITRSRSRNVEKEIPRNGEDSIDFIGGSDFISPVKCDESFGSIHSIHLDYGSQPPCEPDCDKKTLLAPVIVPDLPRENSITVGCLQTQENYCSKHDTANGVDQYDLPHDDQSTYDANNDSIVNVTDRILYKLETVQRLLNSYSSAADVT